MKATVVVPAHNAKETIGRCLRALSQQSLPRDLYEVIVIDDGSTDETATIAEAHEARVIRQEKLGPAAARNLGAAAAEGEIILFTDADCAPCQTWIERMLQPFEDEEVVGAKGTYKSSQRQLVARFVQLEYEDKYDRMRRDRFIDFIDTYSAAYRRKVFLENGGFDVAFPIPSAEDSEFSFRLASRGHKMVFQPAATVDHLHPDSVAKYAEKKFRNGYWRVLVYRKHPNKLVRDSHTPQTLKFQTGLAPLIVLGGLSSLLQRRMFPAAAAVGGVFLLTTAPFVFKALRKDRAVAAVSPLFLLLRALGISSGLIAGLLGNPGRPRK